MSKDDKPLAERSTASEIDAFLDKVAAMSKVRPSGQRGRLIFAMDATASREPTWDHACHIQGQMFEATTALGGLEIQLCYYRGFNEFRAFPWTTRSAELLADMSRVSCIGGHTQIAKVLRHTLDEHRRKRVDALVFVGDCMEEDPEELAALAGELGLLGVPVFIFHEGGEPLAAHTFRQIARLSKGAYCAFDSGSAHQLRELLSAVAVYAAGGHKALEDYSRRHGGRLPELLPQLLRQLPRKGKDTS